MKLLDRQPGLANDIAQRSRFQASSTVEWHSHGAPSIARVNQHVVTACYSIQYEPRSSQGRQHLPRIHGRQRGTHAATVIFRTVGCASPGIGMP
jgi:hypothetical protein